MTAGRWGRALLLALVAASAHAGEPVWIHGDLDAALAQARETDRLILGYVHGVPWEPPRPSAPPRSENWMLTLGRILLVDADSRLPDALASPEFADAARDFVLLEVDRERDGELVARLGCTGFPAIAVIDPAGRVLGVRNGLSDQADLIALMAAALHTRGWLGADASGLSLQAALQLGCEWVPLGNTTEALRVADECEDDTLGGTHLAAIDLAPLASALRSGDLVAARAYFDGATAALAAGDAEALETTSPLWRLYAAACFGWVDLDGSGLVAILRLGPLEAVFVVPAEVERQAKLVRQLELLQGIEPPDSGDPLRTLGTGRALCALGLPRLALPWLQQAGPEADADRACATVLTSGLSQTDTIAQAVVSRGAASVADKARALTAKALLWVVVGKEVNALHVRDRILALEGLPEADRERTRIWLSDAAIRAWAESRAIFTRY